MTPRPNVLLVFSDQETHHDLLAGVPAPHHDRMAARGAAFAQPYCTTPQCTPARASILTGLHPDQTGVRTNLDAAGARELSLGTTTLGDLARAAGYHTAYFGKWHLTHGSGADAFGFDVAFHPGGHGRGDAVVAERAASWLRIQDTRPWLAVVSFGNPHDIYDFPGHLDYPLRPDATLPPNLDDDLSTKPAAQWRFLHEDQGRPLVGATPDRWRRYRSMYYDRITDVDACLGRLLDVLDARSLWPRTCVVYTSDHGDLAGAHGLPFKGPCMYEELVRVPLLMAWEGAVERGVRPRGLVSHLDIVPTLATAIGATVPGGCTGRNLLDLRDGDRWREELVFEYLAKQQWTCPIRAVRSGPYKLSRYFVDGALELYDLDHDPHEMANIAGSPAHARLIDRLGARLTR